MGYVSEIKEMFLGLKAATTIFVCTHGAHLNARWCARSGFGSFLCCRGDRLQEQSKRCKIEN